MDWYVVDKKYIAYLKKYDNKVGNVEYGDKLKLHIGILIEIGKIKYYVPVSSPKLKHYNMRNGLDFQKIVDPEEERLYAVININNMIPVPDQCVTQLKYDKVQEFRTFENEKSKTDYIYLLQKEKSIIDEIDEAIRKKANKLYRKVSKYPESSLAKRCCDFKLLQEKSLEYNETNR
ncbi:MAG: type III toxin-antitoxin system ToxN/AbiQ family toxin [Lachnospiraceae bacterium]|nr:type III toxin-antitoxin system ToxN/AbiQ family toxin [Lachnospiraceae bacterium]